MCAAGEVNGNPCRSSITGRWETPTPRVSRPPQKAWVVAACCANARMPRIGRHDANTQLDVLSSYPGDRERGEGVIAA